MTYPGVVARRTTLNGPALAFGKPFQFGKRRLARSSIIPGLTCHLLDLGRQIRNPGPHDFLPVAPIHQKVQ